ncbi:DNA cytosine methyltransferase [Klebsiella aerogenes]|nr:DNA cytosine methyltransferase [Klebsiella aerogenes]
MLTYGSVCSGIEAASMAWGCLGWKPAWFSQYDPEHDYSRGPDFPSAVLANHWPDVPNLGDMTKLAASVRAGITPAPDLIVGGTPCQAFSVAGARAGLSDPRGQLTISYGELADAVDNSRAAEGKAPAIFVWENVPGVLSSNDNAFGAFLGLLAGEDCELQSPGKRWTNAGYVRGPKRAIAWRILDAQYFGVAQRRRRVFVVASARGGIDPTQILFESDGVRRDTPPSRSAGQVVAALTENGVGTCGSDDNQGQAGHLIAMAHGQGGAEIKTDGSAPTLTCNHEAPIAAYGFQQRIARNGREDMGDICHTLSAQSGETGKGDAAPCVATPLSVRRLTPIECERLQGFPDNHTLIPVDKRKQITAEEYAYLRHHNPALTAEEAYRLAKDGPRYKAIGNSMAVPVMRWIGRRIAAALSGVNA